MKITKSLVSLAAVGALLITSGTRSVAQEDRRPPLEDPPNAVKLSLDEALKRALENNLDLAIVKKDPQIAEWNITFQKAEFDPTLNANYTHNGAETQTILTDESGITPVTLYSSSSSWSDRVGAELLGKLHFGATYRAFTNWSWSGQDPTLGVNQSGFPFQQTTDNDYKEYGIHFQLPLLRGFGKDVNEANILIAEHDLNISHRELQRRAELTIKAAEDFYWDLRAAREAQRVAEQALQLSKDLFELNKKKVEVGTLAPIEITQAEANVASNVEGTIRAEQAVRNAEDNLRRVMAIPEADPMWQVPIVPTETPMSEEVTIDQASAISIALENRAEIANAREQIDSAKINEKAAHNGVKHQLDVFADVARNRFDQPQTTVTSVPGLPVTTSRTDFIYKEAPPWAVGLLYSYPIGNRAAKSTYAVAKINTEKAETTLDSVTQDVRVDVRAAARAVELGYERVVAGRKNVELQQKKLDAEQKKFDNGMSTSFEVFTFQTDLRNAQLSLIQALLDYNKGLADLERAKGTLLQSKNLKLDEDAGR